MDRLRQFSSVLVWALAVVVAWFERRETGDRPSVAAGDTRRPAPASPSASPPTAATETVGPSDARPELVEADPSLAGDAETDAAPEESPAAPEADEVPMDEVPAPAPGAVDAGGPGTGGPPGSVPGDGTRVCPDGYPIKGNATSRIYHLPGQSSYEVTIPEICFATEADAQAAGFRPRRR